MFCKGKPKKNRDLQRPQELSKLVPSPETAKLFLLSSLDSAVNSLKDNSSDLQGIWKSESTDEQISDKEFTTLLDYEFQ